MNKISKSKIALIHVAKDKLGLDRWEYEQILAAAGVTSSTDLYEDGFRVVMSKFKELGFESVSKYRKPAPRRTLGGATLSQIDKIKYLWRDITGHALTTPDHRATLYTFLYKHNRDLRHYDDLIEIWNHLDGRTAHITIKILMDMKEKAHGQNTTG